MVLLVGGRASDDGAATDFSVLHVCDDNRAEVVARFKAKVPPNLQNRVLAVDGPTFLLPQEGGGALAVGVRGGQWRLWEALSKSHGEWGGLETGFTPMAPPSMLQAGRYYLPVAAHQNPRWEVLPIAHEGACGFRAEGHPDLPSSVAARATCAVYLEHEGLSTMIGSSVGQVFECTGGQACCVHQVDGPVHELIYGGGVLAVCYGIDKLHLLARHNWRLLEAFEDVSHASIARTAAADTIHVAIETASVTEGQAGSSLRLLEVGSLLEGTAKASAKGRALSKLASNLENSVAEGLLVVQCTAERIGVKERLVRRAGQVACEMLSRKQAKSSVVASSGGSSGGDLNFEPGRGMRLEVLAMETSHREPAHSSGREEAEAVSKADLSSLRQWVWRQRWGVTLEVEALVRGLTVWLVAAGVGEATTERVRVPAGGVREVSLSLPAEAIRRCLFDQGEFPLSVLWEDDDNGTGSLPLPWIRPTPGTHGAVPAREHWAGPRRHLHLQSRQVRGAWWDISTLLRELFMMAPLDPSGRVFESTQAHPLYGRLRAVCLHREEGHTVLEVVAAERHAACTLDLVEKTLREALPTGASLVGHPPWNQSQVSAAVTSLACLLASTSTVAPTQAEEGQSSKLREATEKAARRLA